MINRIRQLSSSRFARNVAVVATGTAGAQAVAMLFIPVITRLYGPEAFGILGAFAAILAVLTPMAALSYPIAIVLPKSDSEALGLAKISMLIAIMMSLLVAVVLMAIDALDLSFFNFNEITSFLFFLPLAMLCSAAVAVLNQCLIRKGGFKFRAKVAVAQAFLINSAKVIAGLFFPIAVVLIGLVTAGGALHAAMLWLGARNPWSKLSPKDEGPKTPTTLKTLAWTYRDFAVYRTPQAVIHSASQSMPVLMLAAFFGPSVAGLYTLSRLVLGVPSTLIGSSVADVFYPKIVQILHQNGDGKSVILKSCIVLLAVGCGPYLVVFLLGPMIFGQFFGDEWTSAGELARWMAVWMLAVLVTRPIVASVPVLGLQLQFLIFEIISLVLRFLTIALAYYVTKSELQVIAFYSLTNVALYAALAGYVVKDAQKKFSAQSI